MDALRAQIDADCRRAERLFDAAQCMKTLRLYLSAFALTYASSLQHADPREEAFAPGPRQHRADVRLRPDRVRARPHRQLPDVRLPGRAAPDAEIPARATMSGR